MYVMIFDTETTSLDKPFCYNIGYVIADVDTREIVLKRDYVCEQVWHNPMLFTTAYYSDKREKYVSYMRGRKTLMRKFGFVCQQMIRDIKEFDISIAFAYNSDFDERVFNFNCDWFKCNNPFDNVEIRDIRGFAHNFIVSENYKKFCESNSFFTKDGNYSSTAECMYRYITNDIEFIEEHTALSDSEIETEILFYCLYLGAEIENKYSVLRSIPRKVTKTLVIEKDKNTIFSIECNNYTVYKTKNKIIVK